MFTDDGEYAVVKKVKEFSRIVAAYNAGSSGCELVMISSKDALNGRIFFISKRMIEKRGKILYCKKSDLLAELKDTDVVEKIGVRFGYGKDYRGHYPAIEYADREARNHRRT